MTVQTITTTTRSLATAYSNQKKAATLSTGRTVVMFDVGGNSASPYYSDDGATWTNAAPGDPIAGWANGSIRAYVDTPGAVERLVVVWQQTGTGGGRTSGRVYVMAGTFNAGRTALTWGTALNFATNATDYHYPDLEVMPYSTGAKVFVQVSYMAGANNGTTENRFNVDSSGVVTDDLAGTGGTNHGVAVDIWPSLTLNPTTGDIYSAWSAGSAGAGKGVRFRKWTWNSGTGVWTGGTEVDVATDIYIPAADYAVICQWDAARSLVVVGCKCQSSTLRVYDSSNFTSFTARVSTTFVDSNQVYGTGMAIEQATGDVYLFGSQYNGTAYADVLYWKATRSGSSLTLAGSKVTTDTFTGNAGATVNPPFTYAWYSATSSAIRWIYTSGSASPWSVKTDAISFNTAPTISVTSPADASSTTDTTPDFVLSVTDPNASQTLTVTLEIYSDSGLTTLVQTLTGTTATPASSAAVTLTATALTRSVSPYYWRAKVSDGTATSSWTTTRSLTVGWDAPTVTIGATTPATTISTGGPDISVGWTFAQTQSLTQASYRIRVQNAAGSTTYYDSGVIMSAASSATVDAVAGGVPADTTGTALKVVVDVVAATSSGAGTASKAFDIQWGVVSLSITNPTNNSVIAATAMTPSWSFSSTRSKTQASYRFRLLQAGTGAVLYDSGFVVSAASSALLGYTLVDTGNYVLEVTTKNSEGVLSS